MYLESRITLIYLNKKCTEKGLLLEKKRKKVTLEGIQKVEKYSLLILITETGLLETIYYALLLIHC